MHKSTLFGLTHVECRTITTLQCVLSGHLHIVTYTAQISIAKPKQRSIEEQ